MAVQSRWANVGNVAVSIVMIVLALVILALGAAATTEYLNALVQFPNKTSPEQAAGLFLFTTGTAHYIIAATTLIPGSLGLAGGITGNKAVYILYAVMDLLTFVAFVALLAWHCATSATGSPNVLNLVTYPQARGITIAFIALVGTMVAVEIIAISFGFIAICWRPPRDDYHKYGGGGSRPPPSYPYRETSVYRGSVGHVNPEFEDRGGMSIYRGGGAPDRQGPEVYQEWETRFGPDNGARRSQP